PRGRPPTLPLTSRGGSRTPHRTLDYRQKEATLPSEFIRTETDGPIGIVTINRRQVHNALNHQTIAEIVDALEGFDREAAIRCMILTGSERAFAAGADNGQMAEAGAVGRLEDENFRRWTR